MWPLSVTEIAHSPERVLLVTNVIELIFFQGSISIYIMTEIVLYSFNKLRNKMENKIMSSNIDKSLMVCRVSVSHGINLVTWEICFFENASRGIKSIKDFQILTCFWHPFWAVMIFFITYLSRGVKPLSEDPYLTPLYLVIYEIFDFCLFLIVDFL